MPLPRHADRISAPIPRTSVTMKYAVPVGTFLAIGLAVLAQPAAGADKASDKKKESHRKAVLELFKTMGLARQFEASVDEVLDVQVRANPVLAGMRPTMKQFYDRYLSYKSLEEDMVKLYTEAFTEADVKELIKFYKTSVGKKLLAKQGELTKKASELGVRRVKENMGELQKMIRDALSRRK